MGLEGGVEILEEHSKGFDEKWAGRKNKTGEESKNSPWRMCITCKKRGAALKKAGNSSPIDRGMGK